VSTNPPAPLAAERLAWLNAGTFPERAARWMALATGFAIPLSTSFSEITTGLFVAAWICSGNFRDKWRIIRGNVVALLGLAMFGLLLAGTTWSSETWGNAAGCVLKFREFAYVPMFIVVFQDPRLRKPSVLGFCLGATILLGLSYFEMLFGADFGMNSNPVDYIVSKDRIIHSLMMVYLIYLAAVQLAESIASARKLRSRQSWLVCGTCTALIGLAIYNILFMMEGRTGYLLLGALTSLFLIERMGKRGIVAASLLLGGAAWCLLTCSTMIQERVENTLTQLQNQFGPQRRHSPDPRMEYYGNTFELIARHPFLGTGTGSFYLEYARHVAGRDDEHTSDPHSEYLNLAAQVGIPGALLFVGLLATQWFSAGRLPTFEKHLGRGIVLTIAVGCVFNSLIMSVTGGVIFAYFSAIAFSALPPRRQAELPRAEAPPEAHPALGRAA
jgi:O-antigen ligase